ncbi:MAG: FAD binding domain-containing protein [Myxococcota bacterium]
MIPGSFGYHVPSSLDEAVKLLAQHGDSAKLLAGGQSLIPAMRFRLAAPEALIDISGLKDLQYVEERGDHLAIGAMTRETRMEELDLVRTRYPLLYETAKVVADPLVRNRATVGGNIAHADPANDHPATMLAYDARVVARGPKGERVIDIDDFFTGLFENALTDDEILTEIRIPRPVRGSGGAYSKIERKVGDYAIAAVAVQLQMSGDEVKDVRIGLTNVSPVPMRSLTAETALRGQKLSDGVLEAAGQAASRECEPSSDLRGAEDYKRDLVRVLVKRTVTRAMQRAKGQAQ